MNELALFAGAGGGILGGHLLGWRTVCAVEIEDYARRVLLQRQSDGILPRFPIWDDVCTFDGKPWRGKVDVISGGFPCQDISIAGKGAGITGTKSGLWSEMVRIIGEVRPGFVFVENSPMLVIRGLDRVLADITSLGYDSQWGVIGAHHAGAPHKRDRIWIFATNTSFERRNDRRDNREERQILHNKDRDAEESKSERQGRERRISEISSNVADTRREYGESRDSAELGANEKIRSTSSIYNQSSSKRQGDVSDPDSTQCEGSKRPERIKAEHSNFSKPSWWASEPRLGRMADGVANRVDRLKAIGNGQVPAVVKIAWEILNK